MLLEACPDHGSYEDGRWPADLLDAARRATTGQRAQFPGRVLAYERAKVIGGCSAYNGCTASWGHRADYDGWGGARPRKASRSPTPPLIPVTVRVSTNLPTVVVAERIADQLASRSAPGW
jgi:hypothetical protein